MAAPEEQKRVEGSPPSVIADTILKAIRVRRPKTRYAAGKYAKPVVLFRRLVSDRMFDRLVDLMAG